MSMRVADRSSNDISGNTGTLDVRLHDRRGETKCERFQAQSRNLISISFDGIIVVWVPH